MTKEGETWAVSRLLEWRIIQRELELITPYLADDSTSQKGAFRSFFMMSEVLSFFHVLKANLRAELKPT